MSPESFSLIFMTVGGSDNGWMDKHQLESGLAVKMNFFA